MYWVEFEGCILPRPIGGHPAVDFCNTLAGWGGPPLDKGEWLSGPNALLAWTGYAGLMNAEDLPALLERAHTHPAAAEEVLERARELRAALYATLVSHEPDAFRLVALASQEAAAKVRLVELDDGQVEWKLPSEVGLEAPVLLVARAAAEFLVSGGRQHVRVCPGTNCGWLFTDPRGRRRWCSMETCGNRAKVRAHAMRRRSGNEVP